jgi:hypothetical protein
VALKNMFDGILGMFMLFFIAMIFIISPYSNLFYGKRYTVLGFVVVEA